jgi:hypothetical protein
MFINSPEKFAVWFNEKYVGAHRRITTEDVRNMTTCGLIGRYRYYSPSQDGEIIRGILQYEQMRGKRSEQEPTEDVLNVPKCKLCRQSLPPEAESKTGRPREYCIACDSLRNRERQKQLRHRRRKNCKPVIT